MDTGFSKGSAFVAFMATNKACGNCMDCRKNRCRIHISKDILMHLSESGEKRVRELLPVDILDVLRALPIEDDRVDKFKALSAFDTVSKICDDCPTEKHGAFCGINITLTALGILLYGSSFQTEKDKLLLEEHI